MIPADARFIQPTGIGRPYPGGAGVLTHHAENLFPIGLKDFRWGVSGRLFKVIPDVIGAIYGVMVAYLIVDLGEAVIGASDIGDVRGVVGVGGVGDEQTGGPKLVAICAGRRRDCRAGRRARRDQERVTARQIRAELAHRDMSVNQGGDGTRNAFRCFCLCRTQISRGWSNDRGRGREVLLQAFEA